MPAGSGGCGGPCAAKEGRDHKSNGAILGRGSHTQLLSGWGKFVSLCGGSPFGSEVLAGESTAAATWSCSTPRSPARASQHLLVPSHAACPSPPTRAGRLPPMAAGVHSVTHQLHVHMHARGFCQHQIRNPAALQTSIPITVLTHYISNLSARLPLHFSAPCPIWPSFVTGPAVRVRPQ